MPCERFSSPGRKFQKKDVLLGFPVRPFAFSLCKFQRQAGARRLLVRKSEVPAAVFQVRPTAFRGGMIAPGEDLFLSEQRSGWLAARDSCNPPGLRRANSCYKSGCSANPEATWIRW